MYIYWRKPVGWVEILWLSIGVGEAGVSILWRASVRLRREDGLQIAEGTIRARLTTFDAAEESWHSRSPPKLSVLVFPPLNLQLTPL